MPVGKSFTENNPPFVVEAPDTGPVHDTVYGADVPSMSTSIEPIRPHVPLFPVRATVRSLPKTTTVVVSETEQPLASIIVTVYSPAGKFGIFVPSTFNVVDPDTGPVHKTV